MSDRTPREIAEAMRGMIVGVGPGAHYDACYLDHIPCALAWALRQVDAERAARETAEREREAWKQAVQDEMGENLALFDLLGLTREMESDAFEGTSVAAVNRAIVALQAERDTLRREHALLRAECAAGREARDHARPPVMPSNVTVEEYGRRAKAWADEGVRLLNLHDAARAATDAAGVAVTGEEPCTK